MTSPIPTPEDQVYFLRNIQRLLAEGQFVASYKFALVRALADLSVLKGEDSGTPLELDTRDIAAKFVELYWRQSRPFQLTTGTSGLILQQNTGRQASIVSKIVDAQHACGASLFRLKQSTPDHWSELVADVDQVVRTMPLWKLQTVGDERAHAENLPQALLQVTLLRLRRDLQFNDARVTSAIVVLFLMVKSNGRTIQQNSRFQYFNECRRAS